MRDGIATRILSTVSAQQRTMKGYGVPVLVPKNKREFHPVGIFWMWFRQNRGKDLNEFFKVPVVLWPYFKTLN